MQVPKWLVVANNEYRIHTSRIRKIRSFFPYVTIGLLVAYVAFIAPALVNLFIDDLLAFLLSQAAVAMVEIILFMIFFYFIIIPVTYTLREVQTGQLEIFLASPIKPNDVLLGQFLGVAPFYAIVVTIIAGFFTAIMTPLGLDLVQIGTIIMIFVVTFFSALWIGTTIAAILRTKFGKTARGKDIGRALAMIIALPMIGIMYSVMGGGLLEVLANPGTSGMVQTILSLMPSSWGAELIILFAENPGNIAVVGFETLTRFGGLIAFFLAALSIGTKAAGRAYSLEPAIFTSPRAKPDGYFYKTVRHLGGGGSSGTLLATIFKDYGRRLENLSKIIYMIGIFAMVSMFLFEPNDPEGGIVITQLVLPLLAAFVASDITLRGKESLFIYKKTPSGVGRFVKTRLLHGWLVAVPFAAVVTAVSTIIDPQITFTLLLTNTGLVTLTVAASLTFALGLFLLNPAFSEKSGNYVLNLMIIMQGWGGLSLVSIIGFGELLNLGLYETLFYITIPLNWATAITLLYLGKRKLSRTE